jgi:hypothetical protein
MYFYYDPTGWEIEVLALSSPPQNLAVGDRQTLDNYHITWEAPADNGGNEIWEYAVLSDWGSFGEDFWSAYWGPADTLEADIPAWDPFLEYQFIALAYTDAGEGEWSEVLGITAIDYCDETT